MLNELGILEIESFQEKISFLIPKIADRSLDYPLAGLKMKKYKILTLGASGAGKTVFWASLFKNLSIQGEYGFYLEVQERNQQKRLNQIYTEIITGETWPKGTKYSEVSEWTFTCRIKNNNLADYQVCQFIYYDYCGGRLTDSGEDVEFDELVKQADTFLGLLDGQKIYGILKNNHEFALNTFKKRDLPNILKYVRNSQIPLHFVISKWDLLEQEFSLKEVCNFLLEIPEFSEIIQQKNTAGCPVRLIPVSSVGSKFARLQPDGSMKKLSGAIPHPFQTEVPLACVFPDGFKARLNQLRREQLQGKNKKDNHLDNFINLVINVAPSVFDIAYPVLLELLPGQYKLARPILEKVGESLKRALKETDERTEKFRKEQENSFKQVKDEETALKHAVDSFLYIQSYLIRDFPESDLSCL